jgi:hypothetical protein
MLQRAKGTETQLICKHFKLIPLMKDGSRCKLRVQTAEELTAACLALLNSLHQQISLSTQALSRISRFFTIPGNTNAKFVSTKGLSLAFSMFSFPPLYRPLCIILVNNQLDALPQCIYAFHFSTCFEQPSAHHQEYQFYQYIIWYISLCVGDCLVCRSGGTKRKVRSHQLTSQIKLTSCKTKPAHRREQTRKGMCRNCSDLYS